MMMMIMKMKMMMAMTSGFKGVMGGEDGEKTETA